MAIVNIKPNTILGKATQGLEVLWVTSGQFNGVKLVKQSNIYKAAVYAGLNPDDYGKTFYIVYGAKKRYRSQGCELVIVAIKKEEN